jgi:hypothetical protein
VVAILKMATGRNFCHFQNGHHNTAKIQHCPISSKFDMWIDNDVPNWFLKFPVEIFRCQESIQDIIIYPHMKCRWNRTMLNLCGIVVAILKMGTGRNFSMSGIISGHHNLPTYEMSLKSDNVEFVRYYILFFIQGNFYIHCIFGIFQVSIFIIDFWHIYKSIICKLLFFIIDFWHIYKIIIPLKSNNVEFVRYCGGHFENGDR